MINSVIFDFDDTVINNSLLDYEGFLRPCKKLGAPVPKFEKIINFRKKGLLARDIALKIKTETKKSFSITQFLQLRNEFLQHYESISFLTLHTGARNLLTFLKAKKIDCFLCSVRKNKKIVTNFLIKNRINQYFSGVYLMDDIGLNLDNSNSSNRVLIKNSMIHKIIKDHLLSNSNIVFIGNSKDDYNSAVNMHVKFIYYENFYNDDVIKYVIKVKDMKRLQQKLSMELKN
jgi:phosphoglycolate phosphatase-like HAD superfamily hydrolase